MKIFNLWKCQTSASDKSGTSGNKNSFAHIKKFYVQFEPTNIVKIFLTSHF